MTGARIASNLNFWLSTESCASMKAVPSAWTVLGRGLPWRPLPGTLGMLVHLSVPGRVTH